MDNYFMKFVNCLIGCMLLAIGVTIIVAKIEVVEGGPVGVIFIVSGVTFFINFIIIMKEASKDEFTDY